jgi:hypothetical protein
MTTKPKLKKRTWHYLLEPAEYGCACMKDDKVNKDHKIAWSEYEGMIWCYDCNEDMRGFGGIFDGPIPADATKMILGPHCFHRYNLTKNTIEEPITVGNKIQYRMDKELTKRLHAGQKAMNLSLCPHCFCMTKTIKNKCGKCGGFKGAGE